jgi:hypothetical protein
MSYFIHDGAAQLGPFSIEELREKRILNTTPVWRDGLKDWVQASSLDELRGIFVQLPPAYKDAGYNIPKQSEPTSTTEKIGFRLGRFLGWSGVVLLLFLIGVFLYNKSHQPTYFTSSITPLVDPERSFPKSFLAVGGTYRPNFWGTKEEISGTVTNKATHTNYKDVHINVIFYSQTNSVISNQEYIIYDYFPYGSTRAFSLKVDKPNAAATCGWIAVGATYY